MEIRIGIAQSGRELSFESNENAAMVRASVTEALESKASHLSFTDSKGNTFVLPLASFAYIEIGTEESRRVGFVA